MLAHYADLAPALAVFAASLAGSAHCVGMCGGLFLSCARTATTARAYHLGRLLAYLGWGLVGGALGQAILPSRTVGLAASVVLAVFFVIAAIRTARGRGSLSLIPAPALRLFERGLRHALPRASGEALSALSVGLMTAFLPCGWLHAFVLAAVASGSAWKGSLILFSFWLGTLPALSLYGLALRRANPWGRWKPAVSAACLLVAALGTLWIKARPLVHPSQSPVSCHEETSP